MLWSVEKYKTKYLNVPLPGESAQNILLYKTHTRATSAHILHIKSLVSSQISHAG